MKNRTLPMNLQLFAEPGTEPPAGGQQQNQPCLLYTSSQYAWIPYRQLIGFEEDEK